MPNQSTRAVMESERHAPPWRRLTKFAVLPLVSILSALAIIPAIAHSLGASAWAAVALGQALGITGSIVINFGWSAVGPSCVAPASKSLRISLLSDSLWFRFLLCLPTWSIAAASAFALAPAQFAGLSASMAVAVSSFGLSNSWFLVGTGQPGKMAIYDTMPKVAVAALSIYPITQWGNPYFYPALLLISSVLGALFSYKSITGHWRLEKPPKTAEIRRTLSSQGPLTLSSLVASGYTSFSIPIVSTVQVTQDIVAPFAGAQRLLNAGQSGLIAVVSALQGWVGERNPTYIQKRRTKTAIAVTAIAGSLGGR